MKSIVNFKSIYLVIVLFFMAGCVKEVNTLQFESYGSMVKFFNKAACDKNTPQLVVFNYDGTKYYPQIINKCNMDLKNFERRNLCFLTTKEREDAININDNPKIVKNDMDKFINNMGLSKSLSIDPSQAKFVLELDENYPIKTVDHLLMALSVIYEEVLHFDYRKQMKGIPIIITKEK